jgi:uncharacterized protein
MPWDFWLIFLFLGVVVPWRGYLRLKRLLADEQVDSRKKILLYLTTIGFQWALAGVVAWRAFARGLELGEMGLASSGLGQAVAIGLAGAVVLGGLQALNLRRIGKLDGPVVTKMKKLVTRLLPVSRAEFAPFALLSVTAGACEEFLYRGFAMTALSQTQTPAWVVVIATSVLFGLAHAYQGRGGIIGTTILGFFMAAGRLLTGSVVPVMFWHAGIDLAAGIAGPKYLISSTRGTSQ